MSTLFGQGTAISGSPIHNNGQAVYGIGSVKPGRTGNNPNQPFTRQIMYGTSGDRLGGVPSRGTYPSLNGRERSLPSGYNLDFSINFGDGFSNKNTVWPTDNNLVDKGRFAFYRPGSIQKVQYKNLP